MDKITQLESQIADLEVKFQEITNSLISLQKKMKELVKSNKDYQNKDLEKSLKAKNQMENYQSGYQSEDNRIGYFD